MCSCGEPTRGRLPAQERPPLRGVIFDMDGVLCDSETLMAEAACAMFRELHGVWPSPEEFRPFMGRGSEAYFGGVAARHGVRAVLPRDRDRTYEIFRAMLPGRLQPLPGARQFILDVRRAGLRTAVATSADMIKLRAILDAIRFPTEWFDALTDAEQAPRNKPAPDVFLAAARAIDLQPSECLVVEDTVPGIQAARAAGMRCLALWTTFPPEALAEAGPDWLAPDLATVPTDLRVALGLGSLGG
ncbi:MAG: HAD-IA family hydrolase [Kiritimatiellae bacterium]|nr:HAD-IA family hydrolase [Kiritimatiellia bacterium]